MLVGMAVASFAVQAALWALLIAAGLWLYRLTGLRGLLWLGAYAALSGLLALVLGIAFGQFITRFTATETRSVDWTVGQLVASWQYGLMVLHGLIHLMLAVLVLGDIAALLRRLGIELGGTPARFLLRGRVFATRLGVALIGLTLLPPIMIVVLWAVLIA